MKRHALFSSNTGKSPVYSYDTEIENGDGKIAVTAYANALAHIKSRDIRPMLVQFNAGAFAIRATTQPLAESLIRRATQDDQAMTVLVHRTPWERKPYVEEKRLGRLGRVIRQTAEWARFKGQPQHLLGHSWVWSDSVQKADALKNDPGIFFGGLVGLTPNGHPPVPNNREVMDFSIGIAHEFRRLPRAFRRLGGLAIGTALFGSIVARFVTSPVDTVREIRRSFRADVTEEAAGLNTTIGVAALLADHDEVMHADVTEKRLREAGVEDVGVVPGSTHLSMVTDYERTAEYLYPILKAQHDNLKV